MAYTSESDTQEGGVGSFDERKSKIEGNNINLGRTKR